MWQRLLDEGDWLTRATEDAEARLAGRWTRLSFAIVCDGEEHVYAYDTGRLSRFNGVAEVVFDGSHAAWEAFLQPVPEAPNHHILGMERRRDDFAVRHGREAFVRHLRLLTRLLEVARLSRNPKVTP